MQELVLATGREYLRRGDFSRWISDVFGDHALARELQGHERRYAKEEHQKAVGQIVAAIRARTT